MLVSHAGHNRLRGLRPDRFDLHEALRQLACFGERTALAVMRSDMLIELVKLLKRSRKDRGGKNRQLALHILKDVRNFAPRPHAALQYDEPKLAQELVDLVQLRRPVATTSVHAR